MLVYRYLSRQLFASTMAVALVLVLVLVFGRFVKYLGEAAEGKLQAEVLFSLLVFRLPGFLELILPLSLFMGILLTFGRMYVDSEMTVLRACGVSNGQLVRMCVVPALMMSLVVGAFSVVLSPWGFARMNHVIEEQRARPEIDMLSAGRFYKRADPDVERVTYAESLVDGRTRLENVFMAELPAGAEPTGRRPAMVTAASGRRVQDDDGRQYLELTSGYRYEGRPGQADFKIFAFETYRVRVEEGSIRPLEALRGQPTPALLERGDVPAIAEWQWRLSLPLMCLVAIILAVPLSRVNPRQGRFVRLLPGVLLFLAYLGLLVGVRQWTERGVLPPGPGPWWVHGLFAVIGYLMLRWEEFRVWRVAGRTP